LKHLRLSTPGVNALDIERGIPGDHLLEFHMGNRKVPIAPGIHLGSPCPVDPDRKAIFDFLPSRLLHKVANLPDLLMAFVFDKWVNQVDTRQAVFIRERSKSPDAKFRAYLIDHGLSFGGSRWEICDGALNGLYHDRSIYEHPGLEDVCQEAIERIRRLPDEALFSIEKEIPPEWFEGEDREQFTRMLAILCDRRIGLSETIERALRHLQETRCALPQGAELLLVLGAVVLWAYHSVFTPLRK
jgi:hypothetical protein